MATRTPPRRPAKSEPAEPRPPEAPEASVLLHLDPRILAAHPANLRDDLGNLRSLTASILAVGVLEPLLVAPDGDGYRILAGHRRCAAAIAAEAPTVPCVERADLDNDTSTTTVMLVENLNRKPLNATEEARGYQQLEMAGVSVTKIAKVTGQQSRRIKTALAVAGSEAATKAADRYGLSLAHAAVIAEFDDDPAAVEDLTNLARRNPGQVEHRASRLRQDRERAQARDAAITAAREAGLTVVDQDPGRAAPGGQSSRLSALSHDGADLTPESHAACPGHAVHFPQWAPDQPVYLCTDPTGHGHTPRHSAAATPRQPLSDAEKADRRQVRENNAAWRAAEPVRRKWITDLLARRSAPKITLAFVAADLAHYRPPLSEPKADLVAALTGTKGTNPFIKFTEHATQARLPLVLLAHVAASIEQRTGVHTWRRTDERVAAWFEFLASAGYVLAPIEQAVVDQVRKKRKPASTTTT